MTLCFGPSGPLDPYPTLLLVICQLDSAADGGEGSPTQDTTLGRGTRPPTMVPPHNDKPFKPVDFKQTATGFEQSLVDVGTVRFEHFHWLEGPDGPNHGAPTRNYQETRVGKHRLQELQSHTRVFDRPSAVQKSMATMNPRRPLTTK